MIISDVIQHKAYLIQILGRTTYAYFPSKKSPTVQELLKNYYHNDLYSYWSIFCGKILFVYIIAHPLIYVTPKY